jgi:hypothetical protein
MEIIKDLKISKAVLKKILKENDLVESNCFINKKFKYIDGNLPFILFSKVDYKSEIYKIKYFDGCFNPFIVKL